MSGLLQRLAVNGNVLDTVESMSTNIDALLKQFVTYQAGDGRYMRKASPGGLIPVLNVQTIFGAAGDGTTDDTPPLQNALDAIKNNGSGVLMLPGAGIYMTSGLALSSANNMVLYAPEGATIKLADSSDDHVLAFTDCDNLHMVGVTIDANKANQSSGVYDGIRLTRCDFAILERVSVSSAEDSGINLQGCANARIIAPRTFQCGGGGNVGAGIYVRDDGSGTESNAIQIIGHRDNGSGLTGGSEGASLQVSLGTTNVLLSNCYSINGTKYGFKLQGTGIVASDLVCVDAASIGLALQGVDISVSNARIEGGVTGVEINHFAALSTHHKNVRINNLYCTGQSFLAISIDNAIDAADARGISISNFEIEGSTGDGVRVRGAVAEVKFCNGNIRGCSDDGFIAASVTEADTSTVVVPSNLNLCQISSVDNVDGFVLTVGDGRIVGCEAYGNSGNDWSSLAAGYDVFASDNP